MTIVSMRTYRHLDVNEAAVRHSGYTREEMLGRTNPELGFWVASDQRDDLLHQLLARGQARDFEVTFRTKTGEERQLLTNSEVITYEGEPAVLSVSVDITEHKHLEAQREARGEEAETLTRTKDVELHGGSVAVTSGGPDTGANSRCGCQLSSRAASGDPRA
jgi:PAS domain S-box-containing protein